MKINILKLYAYDLRNRQAGSNGKEHGKIDAPCFPLTPF